MKKNIVIVMVDELRKDVAYHEKYPFVKTPHLDRLRKEGVTLENAFVNFPTCIPSRASMITGLYPHQMGIFNHDYCIPSSVKTLPERLSENGYDAVAFGKTHGQDKGYRVYPENEGIAGYGTCNMGYAPDGGGPIIGTFQGPIENQHDMAACLQFESYLQTRKKDQPFIAHVGIMAPHPPIFPPKEFDGTYASSEMELPIISDDERSAQPAAYRFVADKRWLFHDEAARRQIMSKYMDLVTYADHCLGTVLQALEKQGVLEETIVVFTADHGEMLGEHEMIGKWFSLYDDVLRVPFVIRLPGCTHAGLNLRQTIEMVDLLPTLLDLTEIPLPSSQSEELSGRSIAGLLIDSTRNHRDHICAMTENAYTVRTERYKLIVFADRECRNYSRSLFSNANNETILYDIKEDPEERRNVYSDPAYAGAKAELAVLLIQHLIQHHQWLGKKKAK